MKKLKVELENCYGIKSLKYDFDFSKQNTYAIYAQNGSMKTSFAKTFDDFAKAKDTIDRIYRDRKTVRKILNEQGSEIERNQVFVIKPIDEEFRSDKESLLLANKELRKQYADTYKSIDETKEPLIAQLKKQSGIKKDIEEEVSRAFYHEDKKFLNTIDRVFSDVNDKKEPFLDIVNYKVVFNDKVQAVASADDFQQKLDNYINKYDELLGKSKYLKKGVFNYYNAKTIATTLAKNGFFDAEHTVSLTSKDEAVEIKTKQQLEQVIQDEINKILTDEALVKAFDEMNSLLDGNTDTRNFREFITDNKELIPELKNMDSLKQKVWVDYFKKDRELYSALHEKYQKAKEDLEKISKKAGEETTRWSAVVNEFNERFTVPFTVEVGNQQDVILNNDVPVINFTFRDESGEVVPVDSKSLIDVLSQGEKKALYILNLIFEIEARKDQKIKTVVVVDDIADSFDYKNKYAIIEYLKDISDDGNFSQIILTHNFDFFRTVENRFIAHREKCLFSNRLSDSIKLEEAQYVRRPFQYFMEHLDDDYMCLSVVPFVRNLIEYTKGMDDKDFQDLTSVLHIKSNSDSIKIERFEEILNSNFSQEKPIKLENKNTVIYELFIKKGKELLKEKKTMMLENKIILSIAIRLLAEKFMIANIKDPSIIDRIKSDQTHQLFTKYSEEHPENDKAIAILKKVNLITPQNIHLNSFMYEPILDMSDVELKNLMQEVSDL